MSSPWIQALRSVALNVPDLARAEAFYTQTWHLRVVTRTDDALYLRGSGADHHLLSLHAAPALSIRHVSLRARHAQALDAIAQATEAAGGRALHAPRASKDPAGGLAVRLADQHGRVFHVVHGDTLHADTDDQPDVPQRLAHAVFNSHDVAATQTFMEQALGFKLADRTKIMAFMNCDRDHHTIALGDTDNDALPHRLGARPAWSGRQRLQLLHRPVRRGHRVHDRGRADRRQLCGRWPLGLDLAARSGGPVGHCAARG
jgi:catechol 2,3-dioxygenase-like lactoylglutathione lyase family enzyme